MIRKCHNHKPQTTPWHREEEPLNHHETPGRQIKQSNQLSLPHQDDCNTRIGAQWLSGRVLDSRPKGRGFEPHRRHCVVVLDQDTFILA